MVHSLASQSTRASEYSKQILVNRGPNSRFVLKTIIKSLCPKPSQSTKLITQNRVQTKYKYQPGLKLHKYPHAYTNTYSCNDLVCFLYNSETMCVNFFSPAFFLLLTEGSLVNKNDLQALYLSGTYCQKPGIRPPSCQTFQQPTMYTHCWCSKDKFK